MSFLQSRRVAVVLVTTVAVGSLVVAGYQLLNRDPPSTAPAPAEKIEAPSDQVRTFCSACHAYPPPETFPRSVWQKEVARGYDFFNQAQLKGSLDPGLKPPPFEEVVRYYEQRAPERLPPLPRTPDDQVPIRFARTELRLPPRLPGPGIANLNLVHLSDPHKLDLLACNMLGGQILVTRPYEPMPSWRILGKVPHPAHAEVVDLDGDGIKDILVANLGAFLPTDDPVGSVVLLRGRADGTYTPLTLLQGVGRVADVQAADVNGDGKLDLIVASFGLHSSGSIFYLENRTRDWSRPEFVPQVLDPRNGAIHVPITDLNDDGKPDFVALISQEHETVVAFLNQGNGKFRKETIYTAPHPAFGSSGIQLVDLDGDGRLDVLLTNGDVLDPPPLLKPYHGIHWLRNEGRYPFTDHPLAAMYGVHRAVAADLRGVGRKDVVAVSFLPAHDFPKAKEQQLDSVVLLEQTVPGKFRRYALERGLCDHVTCVLGAWDGDGRIHLATGDFVGSGGPSSRAVALWKNLGTRR